MRFLQSFLLSLNGGLAFNHTLNHSLSCSLTRAGTQRGVFGAFSLKWTEPRSYTVRYSIGLVRKW